MGTAGNTGTAPSSAGGRLTRQRLAAAAAQVFLVALLVWLWSTGSSDATATTVDWRFVFLTLTTPLALALSAWIGWTLDKRFRSYETVTIRGAALIQLATVGLLALALLIAPFAAIGAIVFGPMG